MIISRTPAVAAAAACAVLVLSSPAEARGTARIQQQDGTVKTYNNVYVRIKNQAMALTSSDGKGTLILGKAACTEVAALIRCLPYDATLDQNGKSLHIPLQSGTVWLNPTKEAQTLTGSSTKLQPRGVLLSIETAKGTYVSLTGTVDEVQK
jgi:hypothetical protein